MKILLWYTEISYRISKSIVLEANSNPCQTSQMQRFAKMITTFVVKRSILDVWKGFKKPLKNSLVYAANYSRFFLFLQFPSKFSYFKLPENAIKTGTFRGVIMGTLGRDGLMDIWSLAFACSCSLENVFSIDKNEIHSRNPVKYLKVIGSLTVS